MGLELSPAVAEALEAAIEEAVRVLVSWGRSPRPRARLNGAGPTPAYPELY